MLRWILGFSMKDRKRNDDIRCIIGVVCIMDKVCEARLRWCGHVQRREEDDCVCVKWILEADVHGHWVEEDRERDGLTSSSTNWGLVAHGGHAGSCWMEKENPCGWPLTRGIHSLKGRERETVGFVALDILAQRRYQTLVLISDRRMWILCILCRCYWPRKNWIQQSLQVTGIWMMKMLMKLQKKKSRVSSANVQICDIVFEIRIWQL